MEPMTTLTQNHGGTAYSATAVITLVLSALLAADHYLRPLATLMAIAASVMSMRYYWKRGKRLTP